MLINLVEDWRAKLDKDFMVGAIFMDLSKAFDCIPHDLIIAKSYAYGFGEKALVLIYSFLKRQKQCVQIKMIPFGSLEGILTPICIISGYFKFVYSC